VKEKTQMQKKKSIKGRRDKERKLRGKERKDYKERNTFP
jgi:hypothetical protein